MRCRVAAAVVALVLTPALAAAQTAPPVTSGETPQPPPPPGLVPIFPPGARPGSTPAPQPPPPYRAYSPPAFGGYPGYYPQPDLLLPVTLYYEDGQTVPEGYLIKSRSIRSFIVAGSLTFGLTYLPSFIGAAAVANGGGSSAGQFAPLFAPVVGPFVAVGSAHSTGAGTVWLALDGLAQTGGVVMFVYGLVAEEKYLQRSSSDRAGLLDVLSHPQVLVAGPAATLRWTM